MPPPSRASPLPQVSGVHPKIPVTPKTLWLACQRWRPDSRPVFFWSTRFQLCAGLLAKASAQAMMF
jgi:hypothetical protein